MSLFGCKCEERFENLLSRKVNKEHFEHMLRVRRNAEEWSLERIVGLNKRLEILEHMFKESKPYKRAECEVLKKHAKQG